MSRKTKDVGTATRLLENAPAGSASGRVLIVAPTPPPYGGMAIQALMLQRMLGEDGIPAEVLGYNQPFTPRWKFLERVPGVRTFLRAARFTLHFWRMSRSSDVVHILAASWLYFFLIVCPAILLGRLRGKRTVLNYRGGDAGDFLDRCGWLARPFFRRADVVTTPSAFLAQVIERKLGLPVFIVPNIVDFSLFRYRVRDPFQPKMLVTRHLESLYDVESVLRAFQEIQRSHPAASLWIAGTGSQEAYLRDLAVSLDLRNVRFLGFVNHASLPALYDECDILLNSSRIDNFPASLMEASAAGLVVVSTKAGGIPFVYENGKNALLVEVGDWRGLASQVERVLQQQSLAHRLAAAGQELCRRCEWSNVRRFLLAAYGPACSVSDESACRLDEQFPTPR